MSKVVLHAEAITKQFKEGAYAVEVLKGVNITIGEAERIAIMGASGSGKTTLLQILGALDTADSGKLTIGERRVDALKPRELDRLRNESLGFVYQFHHLLPEFSALENVAMPCLIAGDKKSAALKKAERWLEQLGLSDRVTHRPSELSGGERQRVAIARAMVNKPLLLLADEPTGNLDDHTGEQVLNALLDANTQTRTALMVVTHDQALASRMDRCLVLRDGVLHE